LDINKISLTSRAHNESPVIKRDPAANIISSSNHALSDAAEKTSFKKSISK